MLHSFRHSPCYHPAALHRLHALQLPAAPSRHRPCHRPCAHAVILDTVTRPRIWDPKSFHLLHLTHSDVRLVTLRLCTALHTCSNVQDGTTCKPCRQEQTSSKRRKTSQGKAHDARKCFCVCAHGPCCKSKCGYLPCVYHTQNWSLPDPYRQLSFEISHSSNLRSTWTLAQSLPLIPSG